MMRPSLLLLATLVLCGPLYAADAPRQQLLMDFGWRFQNGDPSEVGTSLDYPEVKDLAKIRKADLQLLPKLEAERVDAVKAHLGEKLAVVQPKFDDSAWREVDLPHDWVVELPFNSKADYRHGFKDIDPAKGTNIGWYRRTFDLPAADRDKALWLEFDGVYRDSLVWLNGHQLGRHVSGYTSFKYDITRYANFGGQNTLVVRVDASRFEGWFYEGAGIYRHVWLVKTGPTHVDHWGNVVTTEVSKDRSSAKVNLQTRLVKRTPPSQASAGVIMNTDPDQMITVGSEILDADGKKVASSNPHALGPFNKPYELDQAMTIENPHLWSLDSPYLYKIVTTVKADGMPCDVVETPLGIRTVEFTTDRGLVLNGQPIKIKGTCNHQDHAGVGSAMPDRLQEYRIAKLKEMGSNAYRCSHNPPTPELLDACDRLGMLVLDETRRMGSDAEALGQLESLIRRDRNHPCVFAWSIGNEEFRDKIQGDDEIGAPICRTMQDLAHKLDPSRVCTAAMNGDYGSGFSNVIDVMGFNYPTRGKRPITSDAFHEKFPTKPCTGTEDASTRCTRGIYAEDAAGNISATAMEKGTIIDPALKAKGYVGAYDVEGTCTAEKWWNYYFDRPYMSGSFVWTGFDYRGEPTPYRWPCTTSHFGIMDLCGFPKDNYWYYQAWWGDKPVVHLFPHWNWAGKEGKTIDVWVHSNADEVELSLNGEVLGRQKVEPRKHLQWTVRYVPGVLLAKGFRDGKEIARDQVETTGAPAKLVLSPDRSEINADRQDIAVVNVAVVDAQGRTVPTADNLVRFKIEGDAKILGVGNGNPSSHESDKAPERAAFNGLCQTIIQAGRHDGEIHLTATADGLERATVTLHAKPVPPRPAVP